jgi:hypothetical protein
MASWTYHGDGVAFVVEEAGQGVAVSAGGFEAGVDSAFSEPLLKSLEAGGGVGERLVTGLGLCAACGGIEQGGVEIEFADV